MAGSSELEALFGRGEAVFFSRDEAGKACVNLRSPAGSAAEVLLCGGQVVAWSPPGGAPGLFRGAPSRAIPGKALRAGVPVIFPQFGPGPIPTHGFARTALWSVVGSSAPEGGASVTLSLADSVETRAVWPHKFRLDLTVTVTDRLKLEWWIENTDDHPWSCTYLLHTYLSVADIAAVRISGLEGLRFIDKVRDGAEGVEGANEFEVDRFVDRIYRDAPDAIVVADSAAKRRLIVEKENLRDIVVWNPWSEKTPTFPDLGPDDYRRFVCVEAGNVAEPVVVPAGERVVSAQVLTAA